MDEIVGWFLLAGDKFRPKMNLIKLGFSYSTCLPFPKNKEVIQKFEATRDSIYIHQNEPHKACFQHDMNFGDFKDLPKRSAYDKVLWNEASSIAKNPEYDGY